MKSNPSPPNREAPAPASVQDAALLRLFNKLREPANLAVLRRLRDR